MAKMPNIELNFTIDARRLTASRDVLAEVIHKARRSKKSDAYWANQIGIALLQKDFELGAQGLVDDPPFFTEKREDFHCVCADDPVRVDESIIIASVAADDVAGDPAGFVDGMADTLNRVVYNWLEARIPEETDA